jgi:hypothetical protein
MIKHSASYNLTAIFRAGRSISKLNLSTYELEVGHYQDSNPVSQFYGLDSLRIKMLRLARPGRYL